MMLNRFLEVFMSHSLLSRISDFFFFFMLYGVLAYNNHPKHKRGVFIAEYLLSICVGFLLLLSMEKVPTGVLGHQMMYSANFLLCGILFSFLFLKGNMVIKIVETFFFSASYFQMILTDIGLYPLLERYLEVPVRRFGVFLFLCVVSILLVKNHIEDTYKLPHFYWLSLIISCSFSIFVCLMNNIFIPRTEENWELIYMLNGIVSIVFNFLILYLNSSLVRVYEQHARERGMQTRLDSDYQRASELEEIIQENAGLRHDFFNHILILEDMLEKQQNDRALHYLESLYEVPVKAISTIETGNYIADIVLNQHAVHAKQKGILWSIDAQIPSPPDMTEAEFSSLLFNIMDNAVENCCCHEKPMIDIYIRPCKEYLKIRVKNSADMEALKKNPRLHTLKRNPWIHGVGLQLIRHLVEKYDGILDIQIKDGFFILTCMVKTKEDDSDTKKEIR